MAYTDINGVVFSDDKRTLIKCPESFSGSYTIPNGTLTIGKNAFKDCIKLSALTIPVSLELIEVNAFSNCKTLNNIYYDGDVYQWLTQLKSRAVTSVGYTLWFREGSSYKEFTKLLVPDGIEEIRDFAFYYCQSLKVLKFGNGLKRIGTSAFNKASLGFPWPWIKIPNGVTFIGNFAFLGCSGVESVEIPESVSYIGTGCFSYCSRLDRIEIADENSFFSSGEDNDGIFDKFQTKLIQCVCKSDYDVTIPKTCREVCDFAFVGCGDFKVYLSDIQLPAKNVKDCKCKFRVPNGQKATFVSLGFPESQLTELFDKNRILKTGQKALTHVTENPYRVLGIPSTASAREIAANATKIKRFSQAGKDLTFPLDCNNYLPPVSRNSALIEAALSAVNLPKDKLANALFWFADLNESDKESFEVFSRHNPAEIRAFFFDRDKYQESPQNSTMMLYLTNHLKIETFIDNELYAIRQKDYIDALVSAVCGENFSISEREIRDLFLNSLLEECDSKQLYLLLNDSYKKEDAAEYVRDKVIGSYIRAINDIVSDAKGVDKTDSSKNLAAARAIMERAAGPLSEAQEFLSIDDPQYTFLADSVARQALLCCINYLNSSSDDDAPFNVAEVAFFSERIAIGKSTKDWCSSNANTLRGILSSRPPASCKQIESELKGFLDTEKSENLQGIIAFLEKSIPFITKIKAAKESNATNSELTNHFSGYIEVTATRIADKALNNAIDVVNNKMKYHVGNDARMFIEKAWEVMSLINSLPLQKDFREKRFNPNNKTIREMYEKLHTDADSFDAVFEKAGVKSPFKTPVTLPIHKLDLRSEQELFADCEKDLDSCRKYIADYPQGRFINAVLAYKEALDWENAKTIEDYRLYVSNHPTGQHIEKAMMMVNNYDSVKSEMDRLTSFEQLENAHQKYIRTYLDESVDNRFFSLCRSKKDLRRYLLTFPDGKHREDADKRLSNTYEWACWLIAFLITGVIGALIGGENWGVGLLLGIVGNLVIPIVFPLFLIARYLINGGESDE